MKKQSLLFLSICAAIGISFVGCGDSNSSKSCNTTTDCNESGSSDFFCDQNTGTCVRYLPAHCSDGQSNEGETGTDCGGTCVTEAGSASDAKACGEGQICKVNDDCISNNCVNNVCSPKSCDPNDAEACKNIANATCDEATKVCISCSDTVKNGDETDVDCGGSCSKKCEAGKACIEGSDCAKGVCENNVCSDVEIKAADPNALLINEIMAAPDNTASSTSSFVYNNNGEECKFVEILNISKEPVDLTGCSLTVKRTDADKSATAELSGTLVSKGTLVASGCDKDKGPITLPAGTLEATLVSPTNMTQSGTFDAFITCNGTEGTHIAVEKATKGISMNRPEDGVPSDNLISHTEVAINTHKAPASPGYCANGGLYINDCAEPDDPCKNDVKDKDESDVDCGGMCGATCANGKLCDNEKDCISGYCNDQKICADRTCSVDDECAKGQECIDEVCVTPASCTDTIKNGNETDVDCGGTCGPCTLGQSCIDNSDCDTNECTAGQCTGTKADSASPDDLIINEVMAAEDTTSASTSFFTYNDNGRECKFVEIVNISSKAVLVDTCSIVLKRTDADKSSTTQMAGLLGPKDVLVAYSCDKSKVPDGIALPEGTVKAELSSVSNITQGGTYEAYIQCGETEGSHISIDKATKGTSMNLAEDLVMASSMIAHTEVASNVNKVVASPGYCANGGIFKNNCQAPASTCDNEVADGNESDVDCGGTCPKCENDKVCKSNSDCASGYCNDQNICADKGCTKDSECDGGTCEDGTCVAKAACDDNTKNGDETDVDCGGSCSPCTVDQSCEDNADCDTGECSTEGKCTGTSIPAAQKGDLVINEIMAAPSSSKFALNNGVDACEFIEVVNDSDHSVSLKDVKIQGKMNNTTDKTVSLSGILNSKAAVVAHNCTALPLPQNTLEATITSKFLTDSATFEFWMVYASNEEDTHVTVAKATSGTSMNRAADLDDSTEISTKHTTLNKDAKASPGYCANGGLFSNDCKAPETPSITTLDEAAEAYYNLEMSCWNESEGTAAEYKQDFNDHNLCKTEIIEYITSLVSKTCADFEKFKQEEEKCDDDACVEALNASWEPSIKEDALNACMDKNYPEE